MSGCFTTVIVADFEYEAGDGDLPNVLCMVAYALDQNLQHARTIRLWRGEFGLAPLFDVGPNTLFVAYSAWAELTCFMALGWQFPTHVFDLHTAFLAASNVLYPYNPDEIRKKQRKRLSDACRAYLIEGWERIDKAQLSKDMQDAGATTGKRLSSHITKRTCGRPRFCYGSSSKAFRGLSPPMSSMCCSGRTIAPRRSR